MFQYAPYMDGQSIGSSSGKESNQDLVKGYAEGEQEGSNNRRHKERKCYVLKDLSF